MFSKFLIIPLLVFSSLVYSQQQFNGYYINREKDTVRGSFPAYKYWSSIPDAVLFKPASSNETVQLTPANTTLFHIEKQNTFIAFSGSRVITDSAAGEEPVSAFLRELFSHQRLRLFQYRSGNKETYYYQQENGPVTELVSRVYKVNDTLAYDEGYKQQLQAVLQNELAGTEDQKKLKDLLYSSEALVDFVSGVLKTKVVKEAKIYKNEYLVGAGISVNRFSVPGSMKTDAEITPYKDAVAPVIFAGFHVYNQRSKGRLFVAPQLMMFNYHAKGSIYQESSGTTTTSFKADAIINPQFSIGYKILSSPLISWSIQGGGGILLYIGEEEKEEFVSNTSMPITRVTVANDFKPYLSNMYMTSALTFSRHFGIWVNYMAPVKLGSRMSAVYTARIQPIQGGVLYQFQ